MPLMKHQPSLCVYEIAALKYELYAKSFDYDKVNYVLPVKACRNSLFKDKKRELFYF